MSGSRLLSGGNVRRLLDQIVTYQIVTATTTAAKKSTEKEKGERV